MRERNLQPKEPCPKCGGKVKDDYSQPVLDTNPEQIAVQCTACDWNGRRWASRFPEPVRVARVIPYTQ